MVSSPAPPKRMSSPAPPLSTSALAPPRIASSPAPPVTSRLPPVTRLPSTVSVSSVFTSSVPPSTPSPPKPVTRSEEHTSELQSLMRISYAVFCLKKKKQQRTKIQYVDRNQQN